MPIPGARHQEWPGEEVEALRFRLQRSGGIVAVNLRDDDELVGAVLCSSDDDLLLVSARGQSIASRPREALRPMGRATSGVQGMRFNADDELLSLMWFAKGPIYRRDLRRLREADRHRGVHRTGSRR